MHPEVEEFCAVDMKTTSLMLDVVKGVFPAFEFSWLGSFESLLPRFTLLKPNPFINQVRRCSTIYL